MASASMFMHVYWGGSCLENHQVMTSLLFQLGEIKIWIDIGLQSKGENDSLAPAIVLVFFPAKEYICIFHMKHNPVHTLSSDGVNMTSQIIACRSQLNVNHPSPKMVLTAKYRSQFSCREFITSE